MATGHLRPPRRGHRRALPDLHEPTAIELSLDIVTSTPGPRVGFTRTSRQRAFLEFMSLFQPSRTPHLIAREICNDQPSAKRESRGGVRGGEKVMDERDGCGGTGENKFWLGWLKLVHATRPNQPMYNTACTCSLIRWPRCL